MWQISRKKQIRVYFIWNATNSETLSNARQQALPQQLREEQTKLRAEALWSCGLCQSGLGFRVLSFGAFCRVSGRLGFTSFGALLFRTQGGVGLGVSGSSHGCLRIEIFILRFGALGLRGLELAQDYKGTYVCMHHKQLSSPPPPPCRCKGGMAC